MASKHLMEDELCDLIESSNDYEISDEEENYTGYNAEEQIWIP